MDKFIITKWDGDTAVNKSWMAYSTQYAILNSDAKDDDDIFTNIRKKFFTLNKYDINHTFKFSIWKNSMSHRYIIEGFFTFMMTIFFQVYIVEFNHGLHLAYEEVHHLATLLNENHESIDSKEVHDALDLLHLDLKESAHGLYEVMLISTIQLILPFKILT